MPDLPPPLYPFPAPRAQWRPGFTPRHSAAARRAVLCTRGPRHAERILAAYPGRTTLLEFHSAGEVLCSGVWDCQVCFEGQTLDPTSTWHQTCWFSDRDVDYLELEIRLERGFCIERSILLARHDRFAYLADAILGPARGALEYHGSIPLAPGVGLRRAGQTRESLLSIGRARALVMPLALGEWRADGGPGDLAPSGRAIHLRQQACGRRMLAPLWVDFDRQRIARPRTWRRLTVAEDRKAVPDELAVGYRVQAGSAQWLVYRSLGKKGNRTLLGHNLSTEMLVARFTKAGEVEKLVEIE